MRVRTSIPIYKGVRAYSPNAAQLKITSVRTATNSGGRPKLDTGSAAEGAEPEDIFFCAWETGTNVDYL